MTERNDPPDMLEAALRYAAQGIHVFPANGKEPLGELVPRGHKQATTDAATIRRWWTMRPDANIAAVPGKSGYCVLDVDPWRNDDEREVVARWEQEHGALPPSLVVASGEHLNKDTGELARGEHHWFRIPEGVPAFSKVKWEGVEIKGDGGYVLMPPSRHKSGVRYEVKSGDLEHVALAPTWLLDGAQVRASSDDRAQESAGALTGVRIGQRTLRALDQGLPTEEGKTHREVAVGIARNLREARTDERLALHLMAQILLHPASSLDPSRPWTEADAEKIVTSVYRSSAPDRDTYATERTPPASRLRLISLREAYEVAQEEVDWVVPDLLAAGEKMVIAGPPKSLKTWFALHLMRCVATGEAVLEEEAWRPERRQPVLFVQEEGSRQRWARRLAAVFDADSDAAVHYTHRAGFSLGDARHVAWLIEQARQVGARVIFLDPWQRVTPGIEENDASKSGPAWDAVHRIASETGAAVVLLHHSKKGSGVSMDAIRGSSRMAGEVDLIAVMQRKERGLLEVYLDGRDLVRDDEGGNLEVAYDGDRPHVMRSCGFKITAKAATNRTRDAVISVLGGATGALTTSQVRVGVAEALGEARTRQSVDKELHVLADEGKVVKNASGKGQTNTWRWADA